MAHTLLPSSLAHVGHQGDQGIENLASWPRHMGQGVRQPYHAAGVRQPYYAAILPSYFLPSSSTLLAHPRRRVAPGARLRRDAAPSRQIEVSEYSLIASGTMLPKQERGEDAWLVKAKRGGGFIVVADGVGGWEKAIDAGLYARVLCLEIAQAHDSEADLKAVIDVAQGKTKLRGSCTVCVMEFDGAKLRAANVGDSGFRVIRQGQIVAASTPLQHNFNCPYQLAYTEFGALDGADDADIFAIPVQPGDLVVAGSDGLFDNVFDADIAKVATETAMPLCNSSPLAATKAVSEALTKLALKHSKDVTYVSPFAQEVRKVYSGSRDYQGGKVDDITVVVGVVVNSTSSATDVEAALTASEQLATWTEVARKEAKEEEKWTAKFLTMFKRIEAQEVKELQKAADVIGAMDKDTVLNLLRERGLSIQGTMGLLQERLFEAKVAEIDAARAAREKAALDKIAKERAEAKAFEEWYAAKKLAEIKASEEKAARRKAAAEKAAAERAAERAAAERAAAERVAAKKEAEERAAAERASAERIAAVLAAEKAIAGEKAAAEKLAAEKLMRIHELGWWWRWSGRVATVSSSRDSAPD
eukprot:gnl/TRDRNA2_/TRDRNA2_136501_c0_seq1.p1 gnl/TRDRNA2_/TRDRNA2_136501_c0~~gnl/TRDRNA2_/TRDRNA2_136501_c0_seq1.p1  ORF type:complete len:619 (+),score=141.92 gnl/TRDRNA2_/TRDRNA2_136501_c0_seq1:97-1857(+)